MATATVDTPTVDPLVQMQLEGEAVYRKIVLALVEGDDVSPDDIRDALAAAGRTTKDLVAHRKRIESRQSSAEGAERVREQFAEITRLEEEAEPHAKAYWKLRREYDEQAAEPYRKWQEIVELLPDRERSARRAEVHARQDIESGRPPAEYAKRSDEVDQSHTTLHHARNYIGKANGQVEAIGREVSELKPEKGGEKLSKDAALKLKDAQRRLVEANKQFKTAEQRLEACELIYERRREHLYAVDKDWRIIDWD